MKCAMRMVAFAVSPARTLGRSNATVMSSGTIAAESCRVSGAPMVSTVASGTVPIPSLANVMDDAGSDTAKSRVGDALWIVTVTLEVPVFEAESKALATKAWTPSEARSEEHTSELQSHSDL